MHPTRRLAAALLAATVTCALPARADYPDKPVRILVGFPPGSTGDVIARVLAPKLAEGLGQPVIVENRTGAGSSIAAEAVAHAPPDGYTLLLSTTANVINQSVTPNLKFNFMSDLVPVMLIAENPVLLVTPAASRFNSIAAIVAAAKAAPGKLTYASSGYGTFTHLYGELFSRTTGIKLTHVPYRGSTPATTDLLAGLVDMAFTPATPVVPQVNAGRLKAIAVIGRGRMPALPNVPTFAEAKIAGFDSALWFGLSAPAGTPQPIVDRLFAQLSRVLDQTEVKALLSVQSVYVVGVNGAQFARQIARENAQWAAVVKSADIKSE